MSASTQSNGKKSSSAGNSSTNTPSTTPVSSVANSSSSQAPAQSTTPPNNAPKYGTLVPNRIFVGGISANTTEAELLQLFSNYGTVKAAKIIQDRAGVSKGYGFITFESEEEAKRLQRESDNIVLRERKLNIAPAIKKQPFSRAFDASSPPTIATSGATPYFIPAASVPFYQGGVTYYPPPAPPGDPATQHQQPAVYQPPTMYPAQSGPPQTAAYPSVVYPTQTLYMPQQFPYQPVPYDYNYYTNGGAQYMVGSQGTPQPQPPPVQPPGSPPRNSCYNPQLSYSTDAVYYNLPLYGGPVENATVYQDTLDMANGNLAEDNGCFEMAIQEMDSPSVTHPHNLDTNTTIPSSEAIPNCTTADTIRQSSTPVVSLLSIDQHQEKDLTAMQSGRRQRPVEEATPMSVALPPSHTHPIRPDDMPYRGSVNNPNFVGQVAYNGDFASSTSSEFSGPPKYSHKNYSGHYNNYSSRDRQPWHNKRRGRQSTSGDTRPESSSPANVDENRNEEKVRPTTVNTPPPAPYSPIMQYGLTNNKYNTRSFHHSRTTRGGFHVNFNNNHSHRSHQLSHLHGVPSNRGGYPVYARKSNFRNFTPRNNNQVDDKSSETNGQAEDVEPEAAETIVADTTQALPHISGSNSDTSPVSAQVPPSGSPNFVPPPRRTRRSTRRPTHPGAAPLSEIGAGDAPLPSSEVTDACKKLDNLKL